MHCVTSVMAFQQQASEALHMKDKAIADCRQLLQLSPGLGEAQEMINRLS